jgi:hypothetical protein
VQLCSLHTFLSSLAVALAGCGARSSEAKGSGPRIGDGLRELARAVHGAALQLELE